MFRILCSLRGKERHLFLRIPLIDPRKKKQLTKDPYLYVSFVVAKVVRRWINHSKSCPTQRIQEDCQMGWVDWRGDIWLNKPQHLTIVGLDVALIDSGQAEFVRVRQ